MNQEKIGKFIAQCRKEKNLTQIQLAEKLNISDKAVSKWETGRGMPDSSIMLQLCNYLEINVNELLSGEHLKDTQYEEKANENIINIVKEADRSKKTKNMIIIVLAILLFIFLMIKISIAIYNNIEISLDYDDSLIKCEIENDNIICTFNGSSLVSLSSEAINTDTETLIFITGKMLLQNKIRSHFETWHSMAQLNNGESPTFNSQIIIDKNKNIENCKDKIKVYYTTESFTKIKKATKEELQKIVEESHLMNEN